MKKWLGIGAAVIVCGIALGWVMWHNSPMREIERSRDAVAAAKSWHFHRVRYIGGLPPETYDVDIVCPLFEHTITSSTRQDGTPLVFDSILYSGRVFSHVGDRWTLAGANNPNVSGEVPILECTAGLMGADQTSTTYGAMLDGSVEPGGYRTVEGDDCRDYKVAVPTPHDPVEKQFQFSICINEEDHLPRETRHTLQGASQESVSTYSKWGVLREPELPAGFPE